MHFSVDPAIFALCPSLHVGLLIVSEADNGGQHEELTRLLREAEAGARTRMTEETFKQHPLILAWQEVHKAFGSNPGKFPPSVQALLKRVVKGGNLPTVNPLVDAYNVVSLRHVLPAGGEDLDACVGDIRLVRAEGGEPFTEIGGKTDDPALPGEPIYRDDAGVLCRRFNWREADRTKLTQQTRNAVLVLETVAPMDGAALASALEVLAGLVSRFTAANVTTAVLDAQSPETEL